VLTLFQLWLKEYRAAHCESLQFKLDPTPTHYSEISIQDSGRYKFCRLWAHVVVRFENHDEGRLYMNGLRLSLFERLKFGRTRLIPMEVGDVNVLELTNHVEQTPERLARGIPVEGRFNSEPYEFMWGCVLSEGLGINLNRNHFLRITMEAMAQAPLSRDINVDWEAAREDGKHSRLSLVPTQSMSALQSLIVAGIIMLFASAATWGVIESFRSVRRGTTEAVKTQAPMTAPIEVYPPFHHAHDVYKQLGDPLAKEESAGSLPELHVHELATVFWSETIGGFYTLFHDEGRWEFESDPTCNDVDKDKDWWSTAYVTKTFHPPPGKKPPYGGVAAHWASNRPKWTLIGWMNWQCVFGPMTIWIQRFKNDQVLIGPVRKSSTSNEAQVVIILADHKYHLVPFEGEVPACLPPEKP
jgi:hypothetical protein